MDAPSQAHRTRRNEPCEAQNAQQLAQSYQKVIDKGLTKFQTMEQEKSQVVKEKNTERIILISLLVVSLISVGGLLVKLRSNSFQLKRVKKQD